jgi:deazaflavin-dependent oxidoreductase (nitroreductase family)
MPSPRPAGLDKPWVPDVIHAMSRVQTWMYQRTGGLLGSRWYLGGTLRRGGVPLCLLTTRGRRSGQPRTTPLLFIRDGETVVVVGSQGGLPSDPQWVRNLRADPHCELQVGRDRRPHRARIAKDAERDRLWPILVAYYPDFESYASWTERTIPVLILEPVS